MPGQVINCTRFVDKKPLNKKLGLKTEHSTIEKKFFNPDFLYIRAPIKFWG